MNLCDYVRDDDYGDHLLMILPMLRSGPILKDGAGTEETKFCRLTVTAAKALPKTKNWMQQLFGGEYENVIELARAGYIKFDRSFCKKFEKRFKGVCCCYKQTTRTMT